MDIISKLTHSLSPGGEACYSLSVPSTSPPLLPLFFFPASLFPPLSAGFFARLCIFYQSCPSLFNCTLALSLSLPAIILLSSARIISTSSLPIHFLWIWIPPHHSFHFLLLIPVTVLCFPQHYPYSPVVFWLLLVHSEIYRHVWSHKRVTSCTEKIFPRCRWWIWSSSVGRP